MSPTTPTNFHRCIIEGIVLESSQLGLLTALPKTSRCYRVVDVAQPNTQISHLPFPLPLSCQKGVMWLHTTLPAVCLALCKFSHICLYNACVHKERCFNNVMTELIASTQFWSYCLRRNTLKCNKLTISSRSCGICGVWNGSHFGLGICLRKWQNGFHERSLI